MENDISLHFFVKLHYEDSLLALHLSLYLSQWHAIICFPILVKSCYILFLGQDIMDNAF